MEHNERDLRNVAIERPSKLCRLYSKSLYGLRMTCDFLNGFFVGCWLGVLTRERLGEMDQLHNVGWVPGGYGPADTIAMAYNARGLWRWEKEVIKKWFPVRGRVVLLAAGAGREVIGLSKLGYEIDAFEYNPRLVAKGNEILEDAGLACRIEVCARDVCPRLRHDGYAAAVVGWSSYMLIPDRRQRIGVLRKLAEQLEPGSPILLSFMVRDVHTLAHRVTSVVATVVRRALGRAAVEIGDTLAPTFLHIFTAEQLLDEIAEAGLERQMLGAQGYGHAVVAVPLSEGR